MFWYGISRIWNLQMTVRHWHRRSGRALQRRRLREGREVWKGFPEHQEVRSGNKNTDIVNHLLLMDKCCKTSWYWKYTCRFIYTYVYICTRVYTNKNTSHSLQHHILLKWWAGQTRVFQNDCLREDVEKVPQNSKLGNAFWCHRTALPRGWLRRLRRDLVIFGIRYYY